MRKHSTIFWRSIVQLSWAKNSSWAAICQLRKLCHFHRLICTLYDNSLNLFTLLQNHLCWGSNRICCTLFFFFKNIRSGTVKKRQVTASRFYNQYPHHNFPVIFNDYYCYTLILFTFLIEENDIDKSTAPETFFHQNRWYQVSRIWLTKLLFWTAFL